MDDGLERFIAQYEQGLRHQVRGDSEPFLAMWSHRDDVAILGAAGSWARGWEKVRAHMLATSRLLDWTDVRFERLETHPGEQLAVSVTLERMTRESQEPKARTLRVTHAYRREQGSWRLILRHANLVSAEDEARELELSGQ